MTREDEQAERDDDGRNKLVQMARDGVDMPAGAEGREDVQAAAGDIMEQMLSAAVKTGWEVAGLVESTAASSGPSPADATKMAEKLGVAAVVAVLTGIAHCMNDVMKITRLEVDTLQRAEASVTESTAEDAKARVIAALRKVTGRDILGATVSHTFKSRLSSVRAIPVPLAKQAEEMVGASARHETISAIQSIMSLARGVDESKYKAAASRPARVVAALLAIQAVLGGVGQASAAAAAGATVTISDIEPTSAAVGASAVTYSGAAGAGSAAYGEAGDGSPAVSAPHRAQTHPLAAQATAASSTSAVAVAASASAPPAAAPTSSAIPVVTGSASSAVAASSGHNPVGFGSVGVDALPEASSHGVRPALLARSVSHASRERSPSSPAKRRRTNSGSSASGDRIRGDGGGSAGGHSL